MRLPHVTPHVDVADRTPERSSWWQADVPQRSVFPTYAEVAGYADIVIVGGGFTGLWAALIAKQEAPQAEVVVLEARRCGWAASGRNGGSMNGYWSAWPKLPKLLGRSAAVQLAEFGSYAQQAIVDFCRSSPEDAQLHEAGLTMAATSPAQEDAIDGVLHGSADMPAAYRPRELRGEELWRLTRNPRIARGVWFPEGATVHPGRLVRALEAACVQLGVRIHEFTEVTAIDPQRTIVRTSTGEITAREIILATNAWMSSMRPISKHTTNLSSHVIVTEPMPDVLGRLEWPRGQLIRDARMFLHWIRSTDDDRFIVGTGAGPLSYGGRVVGSHSRHRPSTQRVTDALAAFVPEAAHARIDAAWGGAIDLSSDNIPYFDTLPGTRIHYGTGYSGHGVNAAWLGGRVLASLSLGHDDQWTGSALCTRQRPVLPPEPCRYLGGAAVRDRTIALEDALDRGRRPALPTRLVAALPRLLGIRVGIR